MKMLNPRAALVLLALAVGLPTAAGADVTIDSAVNGPVNGDGGTFTVTTAGSITGGAAGIIASSDGAITTLTIDGQVSSFFNGVDNYAGSTITSINISGTVDGDNVALLNRGTVGSLATSIGGRIGSGGGTGLKNEGTFTGTISNAGTLAGYGAALDNQSTGQISAFTNSGLVNADAAVKTTGAITTLTNLAGGHLQGGGWGVNVDTGGSVGTLVNSGSITGYNGIGSNGGITTLTNSGTLAGSYQGIGLGAAASVGSFTNSGLVSGGGDWGMSAAAGATIGTLTNSGTFTGYNGIWSSAVTGTIRNLAGGLIAGPGNHGLVQFGTLTLLENTGSITGANAITTNADIGTIENQAGGSISGVNRGLWLNSSSHTVTTITNAGTIQGNDAVVNSGAIADFTNSGSIAGGGSGVSLNSSGTIGTLTNTGGITGFQALRLTDSSGIGSIVNSGTIRGTSDGITHEGGTIASLVNQVGGLIEGTGDSGIDMAWSATFGTIDNAGTIKGSYGVYLPGYLTTFINRGTGVVTATSDYGFYNTEPLATFTNEAGGLIESASYYGVYVGSDIGTFDNAGTIRNNDDGYAGLYVDYPVTTLTNSGTISGEDGIDKNDEIGSLTNTATGLLQGTDSGLYIDDDADMTLVNYGRIIGGERGIYAYYDFGPFTNKSGAIVSGTSEAGILIEDDAAPGVTTITNEAGALITSANGAGVKVNAGGYDPGTLVNAGTVEGGIGGVRIDDGGLMKITNTGTIRYAGAGTGPAVFVGSGGMLGDATGAGGPAIQSTGFGALLDGTIVNEGTIHHGFTIDNQNVTVSSGAGGGSFVGGTLTVTAGDLTFVGTQMMLLEANVEVDGGTGTVINESHLAIVGARTFDGAFSQSSIGTLSSRILGTAAYGSIAINGAATFGGLLDLDLVGGFALAAGQLYNLFSFASTSGSFSGLSVDGVPLVSAGVGKWTYGSLTLQEIWTPTSMSISAVPEPSTYCMALAGLACGGYSMWRRRKRA